MLRNNGTFIAIITLIFSISVQAKTDKPNILL